MHKYLSVVLLFALVGFLSAEGTLIEHINILIVFQECGKPYSRNSEFQECMGKPIIQIADPLTLYLRRMHKQILRGNMPCTSGTSYWYVAVILR